MIRRQPSPRSCLGQTAYLSPTLSHSLPISATPPSCHIRSGWAGLQFSYPLDDRPDAGLVHAISNWKDNPDTICNCCSCCCLFFQAYHELNHHKSIDESNFYISVNPETCKACNTCVKLCPMNVLALQPSDQATNKKGKVPYADLNLCLGCGVCVHACPTQSLTLDQKEKTNEPPKGPADWAKLFIKNQNNEPKYRKPNLLNH